MNDTVKRNESETKTCPYCFEEINARATKCRWCRSNLSPAAPAATWTRDLPGRRFLGVASALAANTGISVLAWRVLFIVLGLYHGLGLIAYLAIAALTPFRRGGRAPVERFSKALGDAYRTIRHDELTDERA
jgi:phage shock protein PspC (stress-responsive transcriptional regulator)/ribosomal protein L40E